jgi:hypothetical protein
MKRALSSALTAVVALHTVLVSSAALAAEPAAAVAPATSLTLVDQSAARSIADRKAVDAAVRFPADVREVVAFVNIANPGAPTHVQQRWSHAGKTRFEAKLNVGRAPGWRTWSRHRIGRGDAGPWTVTTVAADGTVLGTLSFEVEPAPAAVSTAKVD